MRAIAVFLITVIGAVLLRQIADEFKSWIHWLVQRITKRFIQRAVEHMPENERARYTEELQSYVDEMPGEIAKLVTAFGLRSIPQILAESLADQTLAETQTDDLIEGLMMEEVAHALLEESRDRKNDPNFPDGTDGAMVEGEGTQTAPEWKVKALKRQADLLKKMRECADPIPRLNAASSYQDFLGAIA